MQWLRNSAREAAAWHRRRECRIGLLRRSRLLLGRCRIGRRRGGTAAHDLLRLWRRRRRSRAALVIRCCIGVRSGRRGRGRCGLLALALRFRGVLLLRLRRRRGGSRVLLVELLLAGALVEILGHALLEAGHAFGEHRLAVARKLLLGVEKVEHVGGIEIGHAATAAAGQRAGKRGDDGKGDQVFRSAHGQCLAQLTVSSSRPAAATPATPRRASAGPAASRRHWQSYPAIAASPRYRWRARPTGPAIRARYGGKSRPWSSTIQAAAAYSDRSWFPAAIAPRAPAPDRAPERRRCYRLRCRRTSLPRPACRGWRLPPPRAAGTGCGIPTGPWRRARQRPLRLPHVCW